MPDTMASELPDPSSRQRWMAQLALATSAELAAAWAALPAPPAYTLLRQPETGLAMVRGRAGGTGMPFNLGEMTMTRCAVRLAGSAGAIGFSYIAGRDRRHAELAAVFDALLQDPARRAATEAMVLEPIVRRIAAEKQRRAAAAAATRVEFFTLVREQENG
jgi:alpha-D-ribose 1-methylphosphonate 5-triphosphate synthase subunit PhnG